ncbi:hypothetical protein RBB73_05450 [Tunturiibacter empetritectus]|uniref:hypothetical protein n=1 Tax=Tunturiibacter empetritectus TaxID=3069691 RepID=UPI003D9AE537
MFDGHSPTLSGTLPTPTGKSRLQSRFRRWQLFFIPQQLLQIFRETHHDHDCGPRHPKKKKRDNNLCNEMNDEIHAHPLYLSTG